MKNAIFVSLHGLLIGICFVLGLVGYFQYYNTKYGFKTIQEKTKPLISTQEYTYLNSVVVGVLNDSFNYLNITDKIELSEEGKMATAAKVLYLTNSFNPKATFKDEVKEGIVDEANTLFDTKITYKDFKINYSKEYCGTGGFDSSTGKVTSSLTTASNACSLPYIIFEPTKAKLVNDTYIVKVYTAFIKESNATITTSCSKNQTSYNKIISAYSDADYKVFIYSTEVHACCTGNACNSYGEYQNREKILAAARNNNSYYKFYFIKDNDHFVLEQIKKGDV